MTEVVKRREAFFMVFGIIFGFLLALVFAGRGTGEQGIVHSIIFSVGSFSVHLHHWLISLMGVSFLLVIDWKFKIKNRKLFCFFVGVLLGLIIQGIFMYSDWFKVVYH